MTDMVLAASPVATPLAARVAAASPQTGMAAYHSVLTPLALDAPERETEALVRGAAVHDLGWLRRVEVRGEDRFRWLSGMVTNTVADLPAGSGAWNLVLNAQGRIQGDLTVWRDGDRLELEIAADQYDRLMAHLDRFIIMDDVELVPADLIPADEEQTTLGITGTGASDAVARLGLPTLPAAMTSTVVEYGGAQLMLRRGYGALAERYLIVAPAPVAGALWSTLAGSIPAAGCRALEALRIAEGIPAYGVDMVERDLPQETSQMRALHFNKGCYLGQEIVERIRSRGSVHRHLRQLELDGPLPPAGTELTLDGAAAGHITSAAELPLAGAPRRFALAMVRAEAEARNLPLTYQLAETPATARLLSGAPALH